MSRRQRHLLLARVGRPVVERSGIINIGLEGSIIAGAFAGLAAGYGGVWVGFASALTAGAVVALLFAVFTVVLRTDQMITVTAITLFALGATGTLYRP